MTLFGVDAVCSWGCLWFLGLFGCSLSIAGLFCLVILCLLCCSAFGLLFGV